MADRSEVVETQLQSLDDTDYFASAWSEALIQNSTKWSSGRSRRRTYQTRDIRVHNVRLEYVGTTDGAFRTLLEDADIKLQHGGVYALIGPSGSGKTTLLRRIHAKKIPGFPPQVTTLCISQSGDSEGDLSTIDWLIQQFKEHVNESQNAAQTQVDELESAMDDLDLTTPEGQDEMERLSEKISDILDGEQEPLQKHEAAKALTFMSLSEDYHELPFSRLTNGQRKKASLAMMLLCPCDLLLLDEPTNNLDVEGLLQLRLALAELTDTTVVLASHDVDLINDVATHVIAWERLQLHYYPGNYADYSYYRRQNDLQALRHAVAVQKKRSALQQTLTHLRQQPAPKRGGTKKKDKQIASQRKKIDRVEAGPELSSWRVQELQSKDQSPPDKSIQFVFRNTKSHWGEPLIVMKGVGHSYKEDIPSSPVAFDPQDPTTWQREGFLFDCVDLCIEEGGRYCILGENGSGKSVLLRLLAGQEAPTEGEISFAPGAQIVTLQEPLSVSDTDCSGLEYLHHRFPQKTEAELRAELTHFGLLPTLVTTTNVRFWSGGEQSRLALAALQLQDPDVLILDDPTSNLDVDSVQALIYGLQHWNGTLIVATHDAHLIRSLDLTCSVLGHNNKLQRLPGGVDAYLRFFF